MVKNNILARMAIKVDLEAIFDLRHHILRQGLPKDEAIFIGDEESTTYHFGAYWQDPTGNPIGNILGCATFILNVWEQKPAYQLRGMATHTEFQGHGIGKELLITAETIIIHETNIHEFWCNARQSAIGFYEKLGWSIESDLFLLRNEPHVKMHKLAL